MIVFRTRRIFVNNSIFYFFFSSFSPLFKKITSKFVTNNEHALFNFLNLFYEIFETRTRELWKDALINEHRNFHRWLKSSRRFYPRVQSVTSLFLSLSCSYAGCLIERDRREGKEVTIRVHSRLLVNQEVSTHIPGRTYKS